VDDVDEHEGDWDPEVRLLGEIHDQLEAILQLLVPPQTEPPASIVLTPGPPEPIKENPSV
jgi:hypothetical protein